jgi:hypothetical protein
LGGRVALKSWSRFSSKPSGTTASSVTIDSRLSATPALFQIRFALPKTRRTSAPSAAVERLRVLALQQMDADRDDEELRVRERLRRLVDGEVEVLLLLLARGGAGGRARTS